MAKRHVSDFLTNFVGPLVRGGEMTIEAPLTEADLERFVQELPHATEALVAVDDARTMVLSELVVRPPSLVLDEDELRLAAAVHNALFLVHPSADGFLVPKKARRRIVETAQAFASQPLSMQRTRALARHGLLHNLFDVGRQDWKVSWWTGRAAFFGQEPPTRLVRWSGLRRVRAEKSVVGFDQLFASIEAAPLVATLLRRSPLTHLLCGRTSAPSLHWEDAVSLLNDAEIARAVAYRAIEHEASADDPMPLASRYAAAFEQMLERTPPPESVLTVATFLSYLNALLAIEELTLRDPDGPSPLLTAVLAPERAGQRPRGLAAFFAVPAALGQVRPDLAAPPGLGDLENLRRRWSVHRAQVRDAVGEAVISALAARIARRLEPGRAVEPAADPG